MQSFGAIGIHWNWTPIINIHRFDVNLLQIMPQNHQNLANTSTKHTKLINYLLFPLSELIR